MASPAALGAAATTTGRASPAAFVSLSVGYGAALLALPSIPLIAVGLWWTANTVAHNFIHRPFFRSRVMNRAYSSYLSVLLGFPQRLWRDRHLAHHADRPVRLRWSRQLALDALSAAAPWGLLAALAPAFLVGVYLPGWLAGLALCQIHGYYEHARGTTSYYGRLYNVLFFNDGYHVEHHRRPHADWQSLADAGPADRSPSRWPPILRWLESVEARGVQPLRLSLLGALERLVLASPALQRRVVAAHERSFRSVLSDVEIVRRATIVGGGLFPRTALVLRRVLPGVDLDIVDESRAHLTRARAFLATDDVRFTHARFDAHAACDADLVVVPLAFRGDREALYARPPARLTAIHDWIWRPRGRTVVVSWMLLKRLNLVTR
jgi:hypothetical protein